MKQDVRKVWFIHGHSELCCAEGHRIHWRWELIEDGFPRCSECHRRVYVLILPRRVAGKPLILVADVSDAEMRALLKGSASVEEVLESLGLTWPAEDAKRGVRPPAVRVDTPPPTSKAS